MTAPHSVKKIIHFNKHSVSDVTVIYYNLYYYYQYYYFHKDSINVKIAYLLKCLVVLFKIAST